ncbi:MAG: hypothetical protein OXF73_09200 [Gammaproteobacteria bacterium]|nr:hypothetical protein [Gammaproteobacteria bacterium]
MVKMYLLFFDRNNACFTPAYDLVNIAMFPQFKNVLAMAIGEEFEPGDIHAYQLTDFAVECGIQPRLLSRLRIELADKVLGELANDVIMNRLKRMPRFSAADLQYFETLTENILTRTEFLKSEASEIPRADIRSLI